MRFHLSAAAVAICSSSATTTEAPQVLRAHADLTGDVPQFALAGSPSATNDDEARIDARIVTLDPWAAEVLTDWHTELQAKDKPGKTSRVASATSVLYTGKQGLDSNSAHAGVDQQIRKAVAIADLGRETGCSAGSLRLWAAARHITGFATLITGATIAGIDPFTLHRKVTRPSGQRCTPCGRPGLPPSGHVASQPDVDHVGYRQPSSVCDAVLRLPRSA